MEPEVPPTPEPQITPVAAAQPIRPPVQAAGSSAAPGRYAATHLLVAVPPHEDAEARALAEDLWRRADRGEDLEQLARSSSDDPSAPRGGRLGAFEPGVFEPMFEAAVASVGPGELGPIVRTSQGWHVVRRDALDEVLVQHLTWAWKGAHSSRLGRSREQALEAAAVARAALLAGEPPHALGADVVGSDDGLRLGRRQWAVALERIAFDLSVGEISEPVETPTGVVLLRRLE